MFRLREIINIKGDKSPVLTMKMSSTVSTEGESTDPELYNLDPATYVENGRNLVHSERDSLG